VIARALERNTGLMQRLLVPVEVVIETETTAPVVIVSPSGYRLEGLEPAEAVAALRALG
jgi:hypothetical protein